MSDAPDPLNDSDGASPLRDGEALCLSGEAGTDGRRGAYWGIGTPQERYANRSLGLLCSAEATAELASVPTRLKRMDARTQERLINWGYAVCDAAIRTYVDLGLPQPAAFPYPKSRP